MLPSAVECLGAPVAVWFHYFTNSRTRPIVFSGVVLASLSLLLMYFVKNVITLLLLYSVLCSTGMLLCCNSPFVLINEYFPYAHPRHVLATTMAMCAFPTGQLFGVIFSVLNEE